MSSLLRFSLESLTGSENLYHYATVKYDELKTLALTSPISAEEVRKAKKDIELTKMPGPYYEHISFFFEPPPINRMSQIFGKDHPFWFPGNKIYEHVVAIDSLPAFAYLITESPDANAFFYDPHNDAFSDKAYFEQLYRIRKHNKEIGSNVADFKAVIRSLRGETTKGYERLPSRPNFAEIKHKYAATVPHVMLYPEGGVVQVKTVNELVVG